MPNPYTFVNWGLLGEGKEPVLERREEYVLEYTYVSMWEDFRMRDLYLYNYPIYSIDNAKKLITDIIIDKIYDYLYEKDYIGEVIDHGEMSFPYSIESMGKTLEIPTDLEFYIGPAINLPVDELDVLLTETEEMVGYEGGVYHRHTGNWFKNKLIPYIYTYLYVNDKSNIDVDIQYQIEQNAVGVELMKMELHMDYERDIEAVYLNKIIKGDE